MAVVGFASGTTVKSIRISPTGGKPFLLKPDVIANTEPKAFMLHLIFHLVCEGKMLPPGDPKTSTTLAYPGGEVEYDLGIPPEYECRMLLFHGSFETASVAIYGETVASHLMASTATFDIRDSDLPSLELSPSLDPAHAREATGLACALLSPIPNSPPLSLVVQLMYCLKPHNEQWDLPEFPYVHPDLESEGDGFDLERAYALTSLPVPSDASAERLDAFAERVAAEIDLDSRPSHQAYVLSGILLNAASQHPGLIRALLRALPLQTVFEAATMSEDILDRLTWASSNADVARHLNSSPWFIDLLTAIIEDVTSSESAQTATRELQRTLAGWEALENILLTQGEAFTTAVEFIRTIGALEKPCGIWLQTVTTHEDFMEKIQAFSSESVSGVALSDSPKTRAEFMVFLKARIGVASVLAAYAWADSVPHVPGRARVLAVMRLWQEVPGYREILNHLLLLRQMTFRLKCIVVDADVPSVGASDAEYILMQLAQHPEAIAGETTEIVESILDLPRSLSKINEDERKLMRSLAFLVEDGLVSAIEEIIKGPSASLDLARVRVLRVAVHVVARSVKENKDGEWKVLSGTWKARTHGLVHHLLSILEQTRNDLAPCFSPTVPPATADTTITQLFRLTTDVLRLVNTLIPLHPLLSRSTRVLTCTIGDMYAMAQSASQGFSSGSDVNDAALEARKVSIMSIIVLLDQPSNGPDAVLRTLLVHGTSLDENRDPPLHASEILHLVVQVVSSKAVNTQWASSTLLLLLPELRGFMSILDCPNKVQLLQLAITADGGLSGEEDGIAGIAQWLILQELQETLLVLRLLQQSDTDDYYHLVGQHQVYLTFLLLEELINTAGLDAWTRRCVASTARVASVLADCLATLVEARTTSAVVMSVVQTLAISNDVFEPKLKAAILGILTAEASSDSNSSVELKVGRDLSSRGDSDASLLAMGETHAQTIAQTLEWLISQSPTGNVCLRGITGSTFARVCDRMRSVLLPENAAGISELQSKISTLPDEDVYMDEPPESELPEGLALSMAVLKQLVHPKSGVETPSTPKRATPHAELFNGLVTISPSTAIMQSPSVTGLTKTYLKNDFRQLRVPNGSVPRQNTSRLPSMHVDDFQTSPTPAIAQSLASTDVNGVLQAPFLSLSAGFEGQ